VPSAIAEALAIPLHGDDPMSVVLGHVRTREFLPNLDKCEHLVDAVTTVVERLREAGPGVRILTTSREPLRARGEHLHWLGSLAHPREAAGLSLDRLLAYPAVELFATRVVAGDSVFVLDLEAARSIAEIVRRLEGMALPIELAAGRAAAHCSPRRRGSSERVSDSAGLAGAPHSRGSRRSRPRSTGAMRC
jgi:predicted ATPase